MNTCMFTAVVSGTVDSLEEPVLLKNVKKNTLKNVWSFRLLEVTFNFN